MKVTTVVFASLTLAAGLVAQAAEEGSFEKSLTVSGPVELDVKTDSGGITVTQGASGSLRLCVFTRF
jgi:hypothetical protein